MKKTSVLSAMLLGVKYGVGAILATAIFLPLPIVIGDFFGRIDTVGHYSGPLPILWVCGFSLGTAIPYSLPIFLGVFFLSLTMVLYSKIGFLLNRRGKVTGMLLGLIATLWGTNSFEKFKVLEALGGWIFVGIMIVWGVLLFGWIGRQMEKTIDQTVEISSLPNTKDEPN
jgi:hypothetical protein